jgi:hypothetical protein
LCDVFFSFFPSSFRLVCVLQAGYYCLAGASAYASTPCPVGYYCPAATNSSTQFPCPLGTYSNTGALQSLAQCTACPAGSYCSVLALTGTPPLCTAGYYCTGSATTATPTAVAQGGGQCPAGSFCPTGAVAPLPCPPGQYCFGAGNAAPTGNCTAGYYCVGSESNATAQVCPKGAYCESGAAAPRLCPAGTFASAVGTPGLSSCSPCTAVSQAKKPLLFGCVVMWFGLVWLLITTRLYSWLWLWLWS